MKTQLLFIFLLPFLGFSQLSQSQDINQIPITRHKVTDNITVYQLGETGVYSNMTAVNTTDGIVVVDASMFPGLAIRVREMMEKDFGKNIACLINTHGAIDHTNGNSVFKDVPIYAHTKVKTEMTQIPQMRTPPADISPDSLAKIRARQMELRAKQIENMKKNYLGDLREFDEMDQLMRLLNPRNLTEKVIPDTLFDEAYIIKVGDKTFKMHYNTPSYSASDIIIEIPEEQTLIVGDIFNKKRVPFFSPLKDEHTDLNAWEELFSDYVATDTRIKNFVCTHGAGDITLAEIKEQSKYLRKLYDSVKELKASGKSAEYIIADLPLSKFPYLSSYNPYFYSTPNNTHEGNIRTIWNQIK